MRRLEKEKEKLRVAELWTLKHVFVSYYWNEWGWIEL